MPVIWFTGLPCSGKSTLAAMLVDWLRRNKCPCVMLDGDVVRSCISADLGFTRSDIEENDRRVSGICDILSDSGIVSVVSVVAPYENDRAETRERLGNAYIEVYVDCPLEMCMMRDVKGMYQKAMDGEIKGFIGLDTPYEPPRDPEVRVKTDIMGPRDCLDAVIRALR